MRKSRKQSSNIVNSLSDEIRERYPNLYHSMGGFYVRQILKDLCDASKKHSMRYSLINGSDSRSDMTDVSEDSKRLPTKEFISNGKLPGKNKIN